MKIEPQKYLEDLIPKCNDISRFFNEVTHFTTDDNCYILTQRDGSLGRFYSLYDTENKNHIFFYTNKIDIDFIKSQSKYDKNICLNTLKLI